MELLQFHNTSEASMDEEQQLFEGHGFTISTRTDEDPPGETPFAHIVRVPYPRHESVDLVPSLAKTAPVIVLASVSLNEIAMAALGRGATAVLSEDLNRTQLLEVLEEIRTINNGETK